MTTKTEPRSVEEILAKGAIEWRELSFDRATAKKDARTVDVAFSSEEPVRRWYGEEVLSHDSGAVNLERFSSGRANVLVNHNPDDYVGVVENARIDSKDKMGRATVRFGNSPRADQIFRDVQDGILASISVGYTRDQMKLAETSDDGSAPDKYLVTRWTPLEFSFVTVPADHKVGVGRGTDTGRAAEADQRSAAMETKVPTKEEQDAAAVAEAAKRKLAEMNGEELEKARIKVIQRLCKMNELDSRYERMWIGQGLSVDQTTEEILKVLQEREKANPKTRLDLSEEDVGRFSFSRAILAVRDEDWSKAGFELACSRAVAEKLKLVPDPKKFYVPFDVLERRGHSAREINAARARLGYPGMYGQRDLTVATAGAGGFLVATDNIGFIEMLRNRSVAFSMGARRLSGLQGNVTVPRQSAAATAVWLANEASTITESQQTFVQMALSPKNVGAYTEISRQLLIQSSPGAEGIVTDDLAQVIALAADLAVISGSGAGGQPTGITNTAGIGSVTGTTLGYPGILEFQTDVASSNVRPVSGGYVTTPVIAALMLQRQRFTSTDTPLWVGNIWDGAMSGFPAMSSNQMTAATMLFGDWNEVVVGEWGVLEVEVNPYANFQAGIVGDRAIYSLDVGVRRPFAFSYSTSIT